MTSRVTFRRDLSFGRDLSLPAEAQQRKREFIEPSLLVDPLPGLRPPGDTLPVMAGLVPAIPIGGTQRFRGLGSPAQGRG